VLLGIAFGVLLAPLTVGLLIYGLRRDRRGARAATRLALSLAVLAVFFSAPMWRLAITGRGTDGTPYSAWDDPGFASLVLIEGVVLVLAVAGFVRDLRRAARPLAPGWARERRSRTPAGG
jgi:hypothetical protein